VNILGLTFELVDKILDEMLEAKFIEYNNKNNLRITRLGYEKLIEKGFDNVSLYELFDDTERYHIDSNRLKKKIAIDYTYIPKGFEKEFKGYKKQL
jgi:predicted transcriptional regulator